MVAHEGLTKGTGTTEGFHKTQRRLKSLDLYGTKSTWNIRKADNLFQ